MIDENDLRAELRSAADGVRPSAGLRHRVEGRIAARRRRAAAVRAVSAIGAAAFVVVGLVVIAERPASDDGDPVAVGRTPRSAADAGGWAAIAPAPIEARFQHTSVPLGDGRVLVFGGYTSGGGEADGASIYDPVQGTWEVVPDPPGNVGGATAVWADGRVVALDLDGRTLLFDPSAGTWSNGPRSPFGSTANAVTKLVWTGEEVIVVNSGADGRNAAALDLGKREWREFDGPPLDLAFYDAAWTGSEVLVAADVGGSGKSFPRVVVLALDPVAGSWRELPAPPLTDVSRRSHGFAVWTGTELVIGGGRALSAEAAEVSGRLVDENREPTAEEAAQLRSRPMRDVAAWNPATATWRSLPEAPEGVTGLDRYADAWTGSHVVVWSDHDGADAGRPLLLDPVSGAWTIAPALPGGYRQESPAVWTGAELIIWSGEPTGTDGSPSGCCEPDGSGYAFRP